MYTEHSKHEMLILACRDAQQAFLGQAFLVLPSSLPDKRRRTENLSQVPA